MMSKGPRLRAVIGAELKRRRVIARRQSPRSWVTRLRARASGVSHRDYGGALVVPDTLGRAQGRSRRPLLRRGVSRPDRTRQPLYARPTLGSGVSGVGRRAPPPDLRCRLVVAFARLVDLVGALACPLAAGAGAVPGGVELVGHLRP